VISRVISNILGNAVAFSPEGGEIRIRIEENGAGTRVLMSDQGPGIPSEYHEKIFEKFGQVEIHEARRRHSAGMGLTFCKLAVEAHGGRIGLESEAGKGSTFWFVLPATRGRREATSKTGRASPDSARI
jgi:two-component system, sensor histidine kinase and response regulator